MKKTKLIYGAVSALMLGLAFPASAQKISAILYSEENQALAQATIETDYAITFADDGINILNADKNLVTTMPYDQAYYIQLMGVISGIEDLTIDSSLRLKENPVGSTLELMGYAGGPATLRIFDMSGKLSASFSNWEGAPVDVSSLSPGMYILSLNRSIIKFIKK